ncbi:Riboflavin biosynthesis protein RibD [Rhodopirellula europaea 6C]|uniref:Riboflavin biosynthesis protein RibD n=1 Tax=Rhodopirellula europaea 6C TaxID=1263867 RepID=M2B1W8_9BACT|nr:Riboflavin biosynthesis protein RibD [Rhodopirellula europaea 6C]
MPNETNAAANGHSAEDIRWMTEAIELASQGRGKVEPNPPVGCVLVRDSVCIGRGYHQRFGGPHAEVEALADCDDATGATAYVSLEPCCHHGKTPPCADALIRAKVARVVVSVVDPFDQVDGGGIDRLRSAGIEVVTGIAKEAGEELLAAYLKRIRTGMPWVIAKWAMSLDGRIATQTGESKWITGPASRGAVHELRASVDAIAVGLGTVIADNPLLTVRLSELAKVTASKKTTTTMKSAHWFVWSTPARDYPICKASLFRPHRRRPPGSSRDHKLPTRISHAWRITTLRPGNVNPPIQSKWFGSRCSGWAAKTTRAGSQ